MSDASNTPNAREPSDGSVRGYIGRFVAANPDEVAALLWSFAWFFCVLSAYYMVRPVRETFATVVGKIDRLFLATFITMLVATPIFAAVVDRFDRKKFVPIVYRFFSACLLVFAASVYITSDTPANDPSPSAEQTVTSDRTLAASPTTDRETIVSGIDLRYVTGVTFFVWVSVFVVTAVSIFWSVLADIFSSEQAKRLFGFVAAGGTIGGMASSTLLSGFGHLLPTVALMVIPIVLLELGIFCFRQLEKTAIVRADRIRDAAKPKERLGIWSGIVSIAKSPYLLGICLFLLLGKWCATTMYMELLEFVKVEVPILEERTQLFARENLAVQILTLVFQTFLTRKLLNWINLPATLALIPIVLVVGFTLISIQPTLLLLFCLQVVQRSGAYGVLVPAQETLFTVVSDDEKYKSKNFIDTAVYRGGDAAAASLHGSLIQIFTRPQVALLMVPVAGAWAAIGWFTGRGQIQRAKAATSS